MVNLSFLMIISFRLHGVSTLTDATITLPERIRSLLVWLKVATQDINLILIDRMISVPENGTLILNKAMYDYYGRKLNDSCQDLKKTLP